MAASPLLHISTGGSIEAALSALDELPRGVERARMRAHRKLVVWLRRQVLRAMAAAAEVPQKTFLALLRFRTTMAGDGSITVWIGTNPISAHHLGTVTWTRKMKGARAGSRMFVGTWSWVNKPGAKTGPAIMKRTTLDRPPIEVERVPIHDAVRARLNAMQTEIGERYQTLLAQELRYALDIETRRAAA